MIKVMTIFGTRPEAIKMAPVVNELKRRKETECIVCVTAQHRQMLDQVLEVFDIEPDYDLNIMKSGQTLSEITSNALVGLEKVIKESKPDIILVHGDTTTTLAGALAAFYNGVKIGHVEAGLRTWNKYSPYPEEINRCMVGQLSDLHFAPTNQSKDNLLKEGKNNKDIFVTGNTAIDTLKTTIKDNYKNEVLDWVGDDKLLLLTAHRRENLGEPMYNMFKAIRRVVEECKDVKVVYPIHLNPQVRKIADEVNHWCPISSTYTGQTIYLFLQRTMKYLCHFFICYGHFNMHIASARRNSSFQHFIRKAFDTNQFFFNLILEYDSCALSPGTFYQSFRFQLGNRLSCRDA